ALPECRAVALTGKLAAEVACEITGADMPPLGGFSEVDFLLSDGSVRHLKIWRMPSSSRAYPMKLEKKAESYRAMLSDSGCL
ncbi:MAG: uracil-DNA glycosylase family protein, partial [Bacteroidales bacterium]|nr:uracil-DNA glycosylase family protein [Bacteroidales bacterium]